MKERIKRALIIAIGSSVGLVVGNIFFRIRFPQLYNETWPSILSQALLYLVTGYLVSFLVVLLIEWVKDKIKGSEKVA